MKHALVAASLFVLTLLAYSNSFHSGFVLDNRPLILENSRIHDASWSNIGLIFHHTYWWPFDHGLYRPFTTLSYLFNYAVLGNANQPAGYHWINFFLHFLNVVLVYALVLRLARKFWLAVFAAAIWAVHPVLTESVTNIIGRADLLAAMAVLSGLLIYLKSAESKGQRRIAWLAALVAVTTVGVFSKESAVVILGVISLYELSFSKEWKEFRERLRALALGCAAVAIPIAAMLYQRAIVMASSPPIESAFADNPLQGAHFFQARITAIAVMARYIWLLIWPATLSSDYSYSQIPIATGTMNDWLAWITVAVVVFVVVALFKWNRLAFFFAAFAFVTFLPVANLLFQTGTIMAERFLYLPSVGFVVCLVMLVYTIFRKFSARTTAPIAPPIASVVLCLIIASFGLRTWMRNSDWHDDLSVAKASVHSAPNSFNSHLRMATALSDSDPTRSNISQVIEEYEKSVAILDRLPDSKNVVVVYANAGQEYDDKGDRLAQKDADGKELVPPESTRAYQRALELLTRGEAIDKASAAVYRQQLRDSGKDSTIPVGSPELYKQLSIAYMRLGDPQKAYDAASYGKQLDPSMAEVYAIMGQVLALQGRSEQAVQAFMEGLLASGQQRLMIPLSILYKSGLDPDGCAIQQSPNGMLLNPQCARVHKDVCYASADLANLYRRNTHDDLANELSSRAIEQFGCSPDQFK
jgi:protein O-mannosyl-transferase